MSLPPETLQAIAQFDTCTIANAIEQFGIRLRNEGYRRPGLRCVTGGFASIICYAPTCRVHSADIGEVHAAILRAFHCSGVITNGGVRDLPAVKRMGFPMFARHVSVSHAYTHLVDTGHPVEIFGLRIHSGDLIYADCHGAISIPLAIASGIPEGAAQIRERERRIIEVCEAPGFWPERLLQVIRSSS